MIFDSKVNHGNMEGQKMIDKPARTKEQKRWDAESDANTLAEADAIRRNPAKLRAAVKVAKVLADEQTKRVQALRKVSGLKPIKK